MMKFRTFGFICLLVITIFACRKNEDVISPSISITEPVLGTVYNVFDTLWIRASVSDDSRLVSVKITLLDAAQKPVLKTLDFKPEALVYNIFTGLPLDDIHLVDGTYTIQLKAYDGTNNTNAFTEIRINAVPTELKYVVLISRNGIYGTNVSIADETEVWKKVFSLEGDYLSSDVSSHDHMVYTAGRLSGGLNACPIPSGPVAWQLPLISAPPYHYFEDVFFSGTLVYVAYYDGKISGYDLYGTIRYSSIVEPGYFPEKVGKCGDFVLAGLRQKTGNTRKIGVYYAVTGSLMQSLDVLLDVVAFQAIDKDNVLVFGNIGVLGTIMEYSLSLNKLKQLHAFPDGKIGAVTRMDDENFFISGESAVHRFVYPANTLSEYIPDAPKALIGFDVVNDRLYALYNHLLTAYDFPYANPVFMIPVADSALAFHLMYNK